jgi:hypothetical protein
MVQGYAAFLTALERPHAGVALSHKNAAGSRSILGGRSLSRKQRPSRFQVDERKSLEVGRDDVGPLVQDSVQFVVVGHIENGDRTTAHARIDVFADA